LNADANFFGSFIANGDGSAAAERIINDDLAQIHPAGINAKSGICVRLQKKEGRQKNECTKHRGPPVGITAKGR
jgi:hypothetical protein